MLLGLAGRPSESSASQTTRGRCSVRRGAGRPGDPPCGGVSGLQCEGRTASGSEGGGKQRARCSPRAALFVKGVSGEDRSPGLEAGRGDPECTVNCVAPPRRERGGRISLIFFLDRCWCALLACCCKDRTTLLCMTTSFGRAAQTVG